MYVPAVSKLGRRVTIWMEDFNYKPNGDCGNPVWFSEGIVEREDAMFIVVRTNSCDWKVWWDRESTTHRDPLYVMG